MIRTYNFKIKSTQKIESKFESWLGISRFVYNCALEVKEESYRKGIKLSSFDLIKQLTEAKKDVDFLRNVNAQTLQSAIERLDISYKKFYSDLKSGKKFSKPKWATKRKFKSFKIKQGIKQTYNGFILSNFGAVKVFNNYKITGAIKAANFIKEADGLYLSVVVEQQDIVKNRENQAVCAIDMGITNYLTTSDGEYVDNPRVMGSYLKQLRIENRKLSRMKKGGSNYKKQVKVLQLLHLKIARVRKDFLHKLSSRLANEYGTIIREDLKVSNMVMNRRLSRVISDASWSTFFKLLGYKAHVIKVNPRYTSQKCSKCGHTCKENRKTQSLFECVSCHYTENADLQACFNILQLGQQLMEANVSQ